LAIFLLVLTQVFLSSLDSQVESQITSTLEQDTRFVFARLAYDLENSDSITTPAAIGESSPSLILARSGQSFTYSLENNNLVLTDSEGSYALNSYATALSALTFTRLGNPGGKNDIQISFTLQSQTAKGLTFETKTFTTTLGTR
ncbi:MAG: hypothetical protein Q7S79_03860, partial [bacterium]|nr:hypothetical protein [bacterium]